MGENNRSHVVRKGPMSTIFNSNDMTGLIVDCKSSLIANHTRVGFPFPFRYVMIYFLFSLYEGPILSSYRTVANVIDGLWTC